MLGWNEVDQEQVVDQSKEWGMWQGLERRGNQLDESKPLLA